MYQQNKENVMDNKQLNLKELNEEQKDVIKYINKMILEHQQVFQIQPEELLISSKDFNILDEDKNLKYLTLGTSKIKIYKV